jgi:hypothetical protein
MSNTPIKNEKGQVIGYKTADNTYIRPSGEVVARIRNDTTLGSKNEVKGKGDQGLRLFGR